MGREGGLKAALQSRPGAEGWCGGAAGEDTLGVVEIGGEQALDGLRDGGGVVVVMLDGFDAPVGDDRLTGWPACRGAWRGFD
jgi:hypothetical protein